MRNIMRIKGEVVLIEQENGYAGPLIKIDEIYIDEVFEKMCGSKLDDVDMYDRQLYCGQYIITIERIEK